MSAVHVLVELGPERYALPVEWVLEVADAEGVFRVPGAPDTIRGVRNLRGQVLPVADLGRALSLAPAAADPALVVVDVPPVRAMLAVDAVVDVRSAGPPAELDAHGMVTGAVLVDERLVAVLDVPRLLASLQGSAT